MESPDAQLARLDERDRGLSDRLSRIEDKVDVLIDKFGDQRVVVAKWAGSTALLVSLVTALVVSALAV